MFQYTKRCSTPQKRRARRQNCKVERSASCHVLPDDRFYSVKLRVAGCFSSVKYVYKAHPFFCGFEHSWHGVR